LLSKRRLAKPVLALVALAALAVVLSARAVYRPGSFSLSQPSGLGNAKLHFAFCLGLDSEETNCAETGSEAEGQVLLGVAVPKGATVPPTIVAKPTKGGPEIAFTRNDQVAQEIAAASQGSETPWPPAGTEGIGYISGVYKEAPGLWEWTVDAEFGLPAGTDGGLFGGPFPVSLWIGSRYANEFEPADRPVNCVLEGELLNPGDAECEFADSGSLGIANLRIGTPPQASAFLGSKATFAFPMEFAGTLPNLVDFALTTTSTLPQARVTLDTTSHVPAPPVAGTNRSPVVPRIATVAVPKTAKPGLYTVTLTATARQGGSVSQVATLQVSKAKIKLGGVKLNKAKGTATLSVKVPGAGVMTVSGKGLAKKKAKAKKAKTLKIQIKPKAKTKTLLAEEGQAKVKAKITFKPTGATAVVKSKGIVLKQS
jgi:hypothetical protein